MKRTIINADGLLNRGFLLLLLFSAVSLRSLAQGNFSPYSQMGLGDIEDEYYNRTSGMSSTGIAYRNNRYLINNNPAALSGLADQVFTMELGVRGSLVNYSGQPVLPSSTQSGDITFRRLIMGMKASKHWGSAIGLVPYSTQNYEFNVPYYIQGTTDEVANHYYQGHGSLNKAFWANGYEFFHHLSIGVDAGYIFGQLNQKDILQNPTTLATLVSTTNTVDLNNIYMGYGLQLYGRLGKKWEYSIGGTANTKAKLLAQTSRLVLGSDSSTLYSQELSENYLTLPNTFGVGLMLTNKQKYSFLFDYKYQNWAAQNNTNTYPGQAYSITNSQRGSIGFEISRKKSLYNSKVELSYFQAGLYYGQSYLQINGKQIDDKGVTVAFGKNGLKSPLSYSIALQYGIKGTTDNNLIQEKYANIVFVINYGSVWFTKGRKYD